MEESFNDILPLLDGGKFEETKESARAWKSWNPGTTKTGKLRLCESF